MDISNQDAQQLEKRLKNIDSLLSKIIELLTQSKNN